MNLRVFALLALTACAHPYPSETSSETTSADTRGRALAALPMRIDYLEGDVAFVVDVTIGGTTVEALVDSGSSGLRVRSDVLAAGDATLDSETWDYGYGSGTSLHGHVASATVSLGGIATDVPIAIGVIESTTCRREMPNCPVRDNASISDFAFKKGVGGTYPAIIGVGMRSNEGSKGIANPVAQLPGAPAFVIDTGGWGSGSGCLRIGPTRANVAAFTTYELASFDGGVALPNGVAAWDDRGIPGCVTESSIGTVCQPTLFDSGQGEISIGAPNRDRGVFGAGASITISFPNGSTLLDVWPSYAFDVGAPPQAGLDRVTTMRAPRPLTNLGTSIFFRNRVLFDQARGIVGLRPL